MVVHLKFNIRFKLSYSFRYLLIQLLASKKIAGACIANVLKIGMNNHTNNPLN